MPDLCPAFGKLAGSQLFFRGAKETLLTKEKGKLTWALSHGWKDWDIRIGITDPQISSVYSPVFGGLAPFRFYLTTSLSSKMGRKRMVHLQTYPANYQICEFPSKRGQGIITMWSQEVWEVGLVGQSLLSSNERPFLLTCPWSMHMNLIWVKKIKSKESKGGHRDLVRWFQILSMFPRCLQLCVLLQGHENR